MYYYIAEPVTTPSEKKRIDEIKAMLSQLGIAGEFAVASPARTVEEHLDLAFSKGFTTIVGIGRDSLASRVASAMWRKQYDKAALGFIPFEANGRIWQMIGATSLRQVCEILKARIVRPMDLVELNGEQAFLTEAAIRLTQPVRFRLRYREVELAGLMTDVMISNRVEVQLLNRQTAAPTGFFGRLFGRATPSENAVTSFQADHFELITEKPAPVLVDGQVVAETPLQVMRRQKALKLIINRATIATDKSSDPKES